MKFMESEELLTRLRDQISKCRKAKGLTREKLAYGVGLSKGTISKIENGCRDIRFSTLYKIAESLDIKLKELVDFY